jgi:hypothetical protein
MKRQIRAIALLVLALSASPRGARADPPAPPAAADLATARQLFSEALAAEDQGRCAEAIPVYERIARIAVSPVLYFRLGVCNEALGRVVEAINAFELAAQEAEKKRDADVTKEARARLAKLRPRVARLAVRVPRGAEGVEIVIDDRPVSAALADAPLLVDPGPHHVVVRARSHARAFAIDVTAAADRPVTVSADLGEMRVAAPAPEPGPAASPIAEAPRTRSPEAPSTLPAEASKALHAEAPPDRWSGYLAGGATVGVGLGALVSGLVAHARFQEFLIDNGNPKPGSRPARERLHDSGQAAALASTVLTGAFLVGTGLTAYLLANPPGKASASLPRRAAFAPWAGPTGGGLVLGGDL